MSNTEIVAYLEQSKEVLNLSENLQNLHTEKLIHNFVELPFPETKKLAVTDARFYKVQQLSYDDAYPRREAFENVLLALNKEAFNFVYVLTGKKEGIELHIGIVRNGKPIQDELGKVVSASDYGKIIANAFEGNFSGSQLKMVNGDDMDEFLNVSKSRYSYAGVITGIPNINEEDKRENYDFQGIDRLINSMIGLEWRVMIVCEPMSKHEIYSMRSDIFELYNRLSLYAKKTVQKGTNNGTTISFGKNVSETSGKNWGYSKSDSTSKGTSSSSGTKNSGSSHQEGTSEGGSSGSTTGSNTGTSFNMGNTNSVTIEIANKWAQDLMKYIDEELLERIKMGFGKGMFKTSLYYMAKRPTTVERLKGNILSLFQGKGNAYSPLVANTIDVKNCKDILSTCQNQYISGADMSSDALLLLGRPFYEQRYVGVNTILTSKEVSLLAGLPQKEVPGLSLKEGVEFGLNQQRPMHTQEIMLGNMVQRGRILQNVPFALEKDCMKKHVFIAGVTGSGKTTTCHKLLKEADIPFLVIEPAKTEYRTLINEYDDIVVFTLGNESVAPFRINPFELLRGEVISSHVDMLKASFTSAFPMEASMPQILEEAIYRCYQDKGWNIRTNKHELLGDSAFDKEADSFPILSDLLNNLKKVVEEKGFSSQMKADYIGSLVSRLSNLTVGSKGNMLNCYHSMDFYKLVRQKVIIEMEELKSPEDKALVMGFILSRLSAVIKSEHKKNVKFQHLTLIEEAHRLLSKVEYGDSGSKKAAVETFTDLLAEVRKYGEGLIVVDQIPNKLAPEVLKNTNTKIIHKILARDDKEAVGDTMLMNDKQKEYLSALAVGNAIIFSENMDKPIHVKITQETNTNEEQIDDNIVRKRFQEENLLPWYDEEDIHKLQRDFEKVAESIVKNGTIDIKTSESLKEGIKKSADTFQKSEEDIIRHLIKKYRLDDKVSKTNNESLYENELVKFFVDIMYGKIGEKQRITWKIRLYLEKNNM